MTTTLPMIAGLLCAGWLSAAAAEKIEPGPKGGRILEKTTPKAEFYVAPDKTVFIHFYDAAGKPAGPGEQMVIAIAELGKAKQKIEFERRPEGLVSKSKLPEGEGYNLVVQFKENAAAKPRNYRFKFETHLCDGCKRAEYACTCGH